MGTVVQFRAANKQAREALDYLAARWPCAFCDPPKPLRVGIFDDLIGELRPRPRWLTPKRISAALATWTKTEAYLAATVAGAPRINLDGEAVGKVSREEAQWAARRRA